MNAKIKVKEFLIQYALGTLDDNIIHTAAFNVKSKRILTSLSRDKDSYVRECVADNKNTPKEVLERLSKDKNKDVRYNVADNPNTSIEVLNRLSKDKNWVVKSFARIKLTVKNNI